MKWILKPSLDSENYDRSISRICDEMDFHKRVLGHPNILPFHRVIEDGPSIFIVLELLSADLHSMINVRKAYHGRDALIKSVFLQIIDALQHCHDNSVYHRDLKVCCALINPSSHANQASCSPKTSCVPRMAPGSILPTSDLQL